ncbi:membrane peptidoglycan carboxypeptidase [Halopolyspora algeriensis]|uniref:Membrane peptidoglycan carboxypeptidase n=1 Tax=Halopolyspora algeriensis TaxID=1500506 RepID=A0A368VYK5_9ACTN|nr:transglycosylase domain-containing protein [Halopolyspora algeriensis]RCW47067.1 membrane peptidoglycan carboxypeptidase [Halopolyspora algeriensis]TQM48154.1 membrane peptidoglycan carboxypeptidase [Halopolyspora algeriensis]
MGVTGIVAGGTAAAGAGAATQAMGPADRASELLTHRSEQGAYDYYSSDHHDGDQDHYGDGYSDEDYGYVDGYDDGDPDDDGSPDDEMSAARARKARRARIWRRIRRTCYVGAALMFLLPTVAFVVLYFQIDVKSPAKVAREYNTSLALKYNDGSLINKFSEADGATRVLIEDLGKVSKDMRNATLAAESANFYSNPGFSPLGIARAAWKQLTGGQGGGSTITQQYVKLSTGKDDHTLRRKFTEVVRAFKLTNQYSKDTILKAYLNTAYYGRGAHGIHNAADAYFDKLPKDLNAAESAVLAGMVQLPKGNDPRINPDQAQARWDYVVGQMADNGWITKQQQQTLQMPTTEPRFAWRGKGVTANQLLIKEQVLLELEKAGYTRSELSSQGLQVVTTIDPKAQQAAIDAVNTVMEGQPDNINPALVATDPESGAVRAYYGSDVVGIDWANTPQEPGSSFKPFVTLAGLKQGKGLGETYDGSSPQTIMGTKYVNAEGVRCDRPKHCGVREATTKSVNTAFVRMLEQFGASKVAEAAYEAGIPRKTNGKPTLANSDGVVQAGIALGAYPVSPLNMANAYGALADGKRAEPRFVAKVLDGEGEVVENFGSDPESAFSNSAQESKNLAANVTESMLKVAPHSNRALDQGRPVASKTGTHQLRDTGHNSKAWMVGYTPQLSAAVAMGANNKDGQAPLLDSNGSDVFGAELPGAIWQKFMNSYHRGLPVEQFPQPEPIGQFRTPPPTPTQPSTSSQPPTAPTSPTFSLPPTRSGMMSDTRPAYPPGRGPGENCGGLFGPPCRYEDPSRSSEQRPDSDRNEEYNEQRRPERQAVRPSPTPTNEY